MRSAGYAPSYAKASEGAARELAFQRPGGNTYPKFHIYATVGDGTATLNIHLDQKRPSYKGTHAHAAEHNDPVVQTEATRIQSFSA